MRLNKLVAAAFLIAGVACAQAQTQTPPSEPAQPNCAAPEHRAMDFWLGEWRVFQTGSDRPAGLSTISAADEGCTVTEYYRMPRFNYSGRSLNIYSEPARHWEQFWVDSTGDVTHFVGNPIAGGGMQMTAADDVDPDDPTPTWRRITWTLNADGSVRQHGEKSADRGRTWSDRYDFTYRRVSDAP